MAGLLFFGGEGATERGRDAEERKQICRDASTFQDASAFAVRFAEEADDVVVRSKRLEAVVLAAPVEKIGIGTAVAISGSDIGGWDSGRVLESIDGDELFGMRERQRPQNDAIEQTEDGGGGSDAEGEREDGGHGERWTAAKLADGVCHVLQEGREHG